MIGYQIQDRYLVESELGRGGMGVVYRAEDTLLERPVAIKIVSTAGTASWLNHESQPFPSRLSTGPFSGKSLSTIIE